MYEKCVAWISSTDCLTMTSMYQLLHPDWRKFPHRLQYGWTQDHQDLLQILHHQILNGEVSSSYYSSDSEYEMAGKKHLLHFKRPFLSKPVRIQQASGRQDTDVDGTSLEDIDSEMEYDADDEYDVHPPDIAYTEREIDAMCLSSSRRSSQSSTESSLSSASSSRQDRDPDNDFQVYSYDAHTNLMHVTTYSVKYLDKNRNYEPTPSDGEFSSWVILSS